MKRSTRIAQVGLLLLAFAALSSVQRGSAPKSSGDNRGACCPLMQSLNQKSFATGTNAPGLIVSTNKEAFTNHP